MESHIWSVVFFTLTTSAFSVLLILPWGVGMGWLLARREWRGKVLVETILVMPIVMPPVATGLILLKLLGRNGWLGTVGWEVLYSWKAVVIAASIMAFPFLVKGARVAFESVPERLEDMARSLGATEWSIWWGIGLPLAMRGLIAGVVLSFARAVGEFGATVLVAGYIPGKTATLATSIYHEVQLGRDDRALILLFCSLGLAFGAVALSEWLLNRRGLLK